MSSSKRSVVKQPKLKALDEQPGSPSLTSSYAVGDCQEATNPNDDRAGLNNDQENIKYNQVGVNGPSKAEVENHEGVHNGLEEPDNNPVEEYPTNILQYDITRNDPAKISPNFERSSEPLSRLDSQEINFHTNALKQKNNNEQTPLLGTLRKKDRGLDNSQQRSGQIEPMYFRNLSKQYAESIKRWWRNLSSLWRWTLISLFILLAQLLLFMFALRLVGTSTVKDILEYSELTFPSTTISHLQPSSLRVITNASITNFPEYSLISEPTTIDVLYRDKPLGKIDIPETILGPHSSWIFINSTMYIQDPGIMREFVADLLTAENLNWNLRGNLSLHSGGSKAQVFPFNKDVKLNGLKGIQDITMPFLNLSALNGEGNIRVDSAISLINPSNATLHLGAISFDMFYNGIELGQLLAKDTTLTPGQNKIELSGEILVYPDNILDPVFEFVARYLRGERTIVDIHGSASEASTPWLASAIQRIQASIPVSGWSEQAFITDVSVQDVSSEFLENHMTPTISGFLRANIKLPTSFPMEVKHLSQFSELCINQKANNQSDQCVPFARLALLSIPGNSSMKDGLVTISTDFAHVPLFPLGDRDLFARVIKQLFVDDVRSYKISGTTTIFIETMLGTIDLDLRDFSQDFTINGLSNLRNKPPSIAKMNLIKARSDLVFELEVDLYNPSNLTSSWGVLMFDIVSENIHIGQVIIPEMRVKPGVSRIPCLGRLFVTSEEHVNIAIKSLISSYISGNETTLSIVGHNHTTENPLLLDTFENFTSVVSIPGFPSKLIENPVFHMMFGSFTTDILNPLQLVPLTIKDINATITMEGQLIARIDADLENSWWLSPIIIPPGKLIKTPRLPLVFNSTGYKRIRESLGKTLAVDIMAQILVEINHVQMWLEYQENAHVLVDGRFLQS